MIAKSVVLVALAVTLTAAGALAADPPAQPEEQRRICRGSAPRLGSHVRTPRRCRTEQQWREEDEAKGRVPLSLQVTQGQNDGRQGPAPR